MIHGTHVMTSWRAAAFGEDVRNCKYCGCIQSRTPIGTLTEDGLYRPCTLTMVGTQRPKAMAETEAAARDQILEEVVINAGAAWRARVSEVVRGLPVGTEVTGEDVRLLCEGQGLTPHHANAWGGVIYGLRKCGLLEPTGQRVPMKAKGSHARKTDVYRRS